MNPDGKRIYAGIGSRATPPEVVSIMRRLAEDMDRRGWILRSGGASGADSAFEAGARDPSRRAIYLPGSSFNGRQAGPGGYFDSTQLPGWQAALGTVMEFHPSRTYQRAAGEMIATGGLPVATVMDRIQRFGPRLDHSGRPKSTEREAEELAFAVSLQARNAMQVLGPNLDRPADLVIAWTPGGLIEGGTGQALRMAEKYGIEVRNLGRPEWLESIRQYLGAEQRLPMAERLRRIQSNNPNA